MKKGQITMFMIAGIAIVFAIGFLIFFIHASQKPVVFTVERPLGERMDSVIDSCTKSVLRDINNEILTQVEGYDSLEWNGASYVVVLDGEDSFVVPPESSEFEEYITQRLEEKLPECVPASISSDITAIPSLAIDTTDLTVIVDKITKVIHVYEITQDQNVQKREIATIQPLSAIALYDQLNEFADEFQVSYEKSDVFSNQMWCTNFYASNGAKPEYPLDAIMRNNNQNITFELHDDAVLGVISDGTVKLHFALYPFLIGSAC